MGKNWKLSAAALLLVSACGGSPWVDDSGSGGGGTDGGGGGVGGDSTLPPGTNSPSPNNRITRYEPKDNGGNGYVTTVTYNGTTDTFWVDGLGFDGDNVYTRGTKVGTLGTTAVYEGKPSIPDGFTGTQIDQITPHRALYGVNPDGTMRFAVVRTGGYVDYGFGGFIYQRDAGVTLPAEGENTAQYKGQAHYAGKMASLRDFKARGGLEYGTADMTMDIDFDDFNDGNAVKGHIYNRRIFDLEGNDITGAIVSALTTKAGTTQTKLPEIRFVVGPGVMDDNGEITGSVTSHYYNGSGALEGFETGKYYAIVGGNNAQNVVGVVVVEADDPRWDGVTVRETGGFTLVRE